MYDVNRNSLISIFKKIYKFIKILKNYLPPHTPINMQLKEKKMNSFWLTSYFLYQPSSASTLKKKTISF